jgi:hypothetical protein
MLTERVLFTALPARVDRERDVGRLSVFVTLRVTSDAEPEATLGDTRFLAVWPDVLMRLLDGVRVEVEGTAPLAARITSDPPSGDLWAAIFPPKLRVRPHETEEYAHRPVASYGAGLLHDYVTDRVAQLSIQSPATLPVGDLLPVTLADAVETWSALLDVPSPLERSRPSLTERERFARMYGQPLADRLADRIEGELDHARDVAGSRRLEFAGREMETLGDYVSATPNPVGKTPVSRELHRFLAFHHRRERPPVPLPTPGELAQELDFHKVQTALGGYRFLLLRMGLVVDLEAPLGELGGAGTIDPGKLRVVAAPHVRQAVIAGELPWLDTPWTAFQLTTIGDADVFRPAPRPEAVHARVASGLLDVGDTSQFRLAQIDVDSAASKMLNAALTGMTKALLPRPVGTPDPEALPALHSTGVALLHGDRAKALNAQLAYGHNNALALGTDKPPTLFAEDVTRGYRVDVLEVRPGGRWRSLHERIGRYRLVGAHEGEFEEEHQDEGFVQLAVAEPSVPPGDAPDPDGEIYLHESMVRWEGWSLSAPRPGRGFSRSPRAPDEADPDTHPVPSTNPAIPGGVPLEVAFRARPGSLPRLRFGRRYRVRVRATDLAGDGPTIDEADALLDALEDAGRRAPVSPPDSDAPLAFRRVDPVSAPVVVARAEATEGESLAHVVIRSDHDRGTVAYAAATGYSDRADRHVAPPKTSEQLAELHGRFDDAIGHDDAGAIAAAYVVAKREEGRLDTLHPEDQVKVPYLPDPFSAGAALVGLPGLPDGMVASFDAGGALVTAPQTPLPGAPPGPSVTVVSWGEPSVWWQTQPFRLQIVEGNAMPAFNAATRVLTVALPKAAQVDVRLSSFIAASSLDDCGPYQDMLAALAAMGSTDSAAMRSAIDHLATTGQLWAVTPGRPLALVHAVQHPVHAPKILALQPYRFPTMTAAALVGEVRIHGLSTAKVDFTGRWSEWRDVPGELPERVAHEAAAFTVDVHLARDRDTEPPQEDGTASGRYKETDDLIVLGAGGKEDDDPAYLSLHEFQDTRHRTIRYRAIASSRFREYFRQELIASGASARESPEAQVDVPSSASPPPPRLLYAVPMFGWERTEAPGGTSRTSRRRGGGLRLFLERPWYESGDGELLAALIDPCPAGVPSVSPEFVTGWGYDPLWSGTPPPDTPRVAHFRRRVAVGEDLALPGSTGDHVTAVGHEVEYDAFRDLWTCDIELDLGTAYFPFVRLALARYQPSSVPGAHLSPLVVARFAQVAPDRTVTLALEPDDARLVSVAVTGPSHGPARNVGDDSQPWSGSELELWVERRITGVDDPDLGWGRVEDAALDTDATPEWFGAFIRWSGRVVLPADHEPGRHRVVVAEYERFVSDPLPPSEPLDPLSTAISKGLGPALRRPQTTRRLVFAEAFVI